MNEAEEKQERLLAAARTAERREAPEAPMGFATRVVARAFANPMPSLLRAWESLACRFLVGACAVALLIAASSGPALAEQPHEADLLVELTDQTFELAFFP